MHIRQILTLLCIFCHFHENFGNFFNLWVSAAMYYATNFEKIKAIVECFDECDAASIKIVKDLFKTTTINSDLAFIASHFSKKQLHH